MIAKIMNRTAEALVRSKALDVYEAVMPGKEKVTILMYHRVTIIPGPDVFCEDVVSAHPIEFAKQMEYISKHHNVISLQSIAQGKIPKKAVAITFDDGYSDNYHNAFPVLKRLKLPATIFLTTGFLNRPELTWWDKIAFVMKHMGIDEKRQVVEKLKQMPEESKRSFVDKLSCEVDLPGAKGMFLTWDQAMEMQEHGITFEPHTVSHIILTRGSIQKAKFEISQSIKEIGERLGYKARIFCFPNGHVHDWDPKLDSYVKSKGIEKVVTCTYGKADAGSFYLKRIGINYSDDMNMFRFKLSGCGSSIISRLQK